LLQQDPSPFESLGRALGMALAWLAGLLGGLWDAVGGAFGDFFGGLAAGLGLEPQNGLDVAALWVAGLMAVWGVFALFAGNVFGALVRLACAGAVVALFF